MKTINKILGLLLFFTVAATSCTRDFDTPPLNKPEYVGDESNITIAELKEQYKEVTEGSPQLIEYDYILKANITSSDASGNIFKQIYVQDKTGGINLGADQNNTSTEYALGQTVYINLHGLYIVEYGGQLQIGYDKTQANRIPWEIFKKQVIKDGWPNLKAIEPKVITDFSKLDEKMVNTLVRLEGVSFPDGGKLSYSEDQKTINRDLKDAQGNQIVLRTSGYSNFYKELLPVGTGSIIGIMGKHRDDWQLTIRSIDDVLEFNGTTPGEPEEPEEPTDPEVPSENLLLKETFGAKIPKPENAPWPKVADFDGYDNKVVKYSDTTGNADIRNTKDTPNHVWLKAKVDSEFEISNIADMDGKSLELQYDAAANVYNTTDITNLNNIEVWYNGEQLVTESKEVKGKDDLNKFYTLKISNIKGVDGASLKFTVKGANNEYGFRLYNINLSIK